MTTLISEFIFDFPQSREVMQLHFEQLGFEFRNSFTSACGLSLFHLSIAAPVIFLLIVFFPGRVRFKVCGLMFTKLRALFYNSFYIRFNIETYLVYTICNLLTAQDIDFYNWASSLQSLTASIHLFFLTILPLAIVVFYSMNYEKFLTKGFRTTFGALYVGFIGD